MDAPTTGPRARIRGWRVAAGAALLAAGVAWVMNPPALPHGTTYSTPVLVGQELLGPTFFPGEGRTIELRSVEPVLSADSAAAEIDFAVCEQARLMAFGDFDEHCTEVHPVAGATIHGTDPSLVLAIKPLAAGTVRIEALDVSYREGVRFGSDRVSMDLVIEARHSS